MDGIAKSFPESLIIIIGKFIVELSPLVKSLTVMIAVKVRPSPRFSSPAGSTTCNSKEVILPTRVPGLTTASIASKAPVTEYSRLLELISLVFVILNISLPPADASIIVLMVADSLTLPNSVAAINLGASRTFCKSRLSSKVIVSWAVAGTAGTALPLTLLYEYSPLSAIANVKLCAFNARSLSFS